MVASLNYKSAGVDIEAGNELVRRIKPLARETHREGLLSGIGGFNALFELPLNRFPNPVLVSSTDGVGTKCRLAIDTGKTEHLGIDLVAMCVNDLIVSGAEPLFFLDYYATGQLNVDVAESVISGIAKGCKLANCALVGGETAEMPSMYAKGDFDLAGFSVGVVDKTKIIDGKKVSNEDVLIGIGSSGAHSNGYSLIRKIIENNKIDINMPINNKKDQKVEKNKEGIKNNNKDIDQDKHKDKEALIDLLLEPTKIYVKSLLPLFEKGLIHAAAHITGGGITENLPRVLPPYTVAHISLSFWKRSPLFQWIQKQGNISDEEMLRTFNCGIGMILCIHKKSVEEVLSHLNECGEKAFVIGEIKKSTNSTNSADSKDKEPYVLFSGSL